MQSATTQLIVTEENYKPTSMQNLIHHFVCKFCKSVVFDGKQCSNFNCQVLFCSKCLLTNQKCPCCFNTQKPTDINKKVRNLMELLKLICPGCKDGFLLQQIQKHMQGCDGVQIIMREGRKNETKMSKEDVAFNMQQVGFQKRLTLTEKFKAANKPIEDIENSVTQNVSIEFPVELFIFQKDSRTVSIYNILNKTTQHKYVQFEGNFPHNFQVIQIGLIQPRVFMIGGGDFKALPDSMFQCRELVNKLDSQRFNLQFFEKKRMSYPRHGHSCCQVLDRYIIVSGSRKELDQAGSRVELYDIQIDDWIQMPQLKEGRHYHSSCNFNNKFIYVFGGIQNSNKKYTSIVERINFDINNLNGNDWKILDLSKQSSQITPRQGSGMCQISTDEIIIVGGFNGKFLNDFFTISFDQSSGDPQKVWRTENLNPTGGTFTLFPFQVPTIGSIQLKEALTIDWSQMHLYRLQKNQWKLIEKIKQ